MQFRDVVDLKAFGAFVQQLVRCTISIFSAVCIWKNGLSLKLNILFYFILGIESELEPVTKSKEHFLQYNCYIDKEVKYLYSGLKNVSAVLLVN